MKVDCNGGNIGELALASSELLRKNGNKINSASIFPSTYFFLLFSEKCRSLELPREIIEMIFAHDDNLLQLTMVCPAFNAIISNSSMLLRKVLYKWKQMPHSDRKYGSLDLQDVGPTNFQQVFAFVKNTKEP